MFSNQSVAGQPSPPGMAIGTVPASESVLDAVVNSSHVVGGRTPAWSKESVRYQMVDLLATLKKKPYGVPSIWPSFCQAAEKFACTAASTSPVNGLIWPFWAYPATTPGWASAATSGGEPPASRLLMSTEVLSPPEV